VVSFRDFLREDNFWARTVTFAMIPLCWRIAMGLGRRFGYEDHLLMIGVAGIWVGVVVGHQMYYRWIFPEKNKPKEELATLLQWNFQTFASTGKAA
jgi:hypothetical protein